MGMKEKNFADFHPTEHQVGLLNVRWDSSKYVCFSFNAIQKALSSDIQTFRIAEGKTIEERRLSSTAGAHDCK